MTSAAELVRLRAEDKASLLALRQALDAAKSSVRSDECGDWQIVGSRGWIYADRPTWLIYVGCETKKQWTFVKRKLDFCDVTQDGDTEGYLRLSFLPSSEQARLVREVVRIRCTREATSGSYPSAGLPMRGTYEA